MLIPLVLASVQISADLPRTICREDQLGREYIGDALPGVELLAGVKTGMSKDDVKRIAPKLSVYENSTRVELFPGLSFLGVANYDRAPKGASGITLRGPVPKAPIEELNKRYGLPIKVDDKTVTEPFEPLGIRSFGVQRLQTLKWCDGPRVFVMHLGNDAFRLVVTAERAPKKR